MSKYVSSELVSRNSNHLVTKGCFLLKKSQQYCHSLSDSQGLRDRSVITRYDPAQEGTDFNCSIILGIGNCKKGNIRGWNTSFIFTLGYTAELRLCASYSTGGIKRNKTGASLAVQCLRLQASNAAGTCLIPGRRTNIPHTVPYGQKI